MRMSHSRNQFDHAGRHLPVCVRSKIAQLQSELIESRTRIKELEDELKKWKNHELQNKLRPFQRTAK